MTSVTSVRLVSGSQRGFTLVELMVTVAIVAILSAIAIPSYNSFITKSEIRTAQADLQALSLNLENRYQRTLSYPVVATNDATSLKAAFTSWKAASTGFEIVLSASSATAYEIKATGTSARLSGCTITLKSDNTRSNAGCRYITAGSWL